MAFQAGYGYPVGNVLTKQYKFEATVPKEGDARRSRWMATRRSPTA